MSERIGAGTVIVGGAALYCVSALTGILPNKFNFLNSENNTEKAAHGMVVYQGQTAEQISDRFLIDIGDGTSVIDAKAAQKWEKEEGFFSVDWGDLRGTSSVRDEQHHDQPAALPVKMDYCSDGYVEVERTDGNIKSILYHLGEIGVCNSHLDFGDTAVSTSFHQKDTPDKFNGAFVSFMTNGIEATALAADCPTEELAKFQTPEALAHDQKIIADKFEVDSAVVTVEPGTIAVTKPEDQAYLDSELKNFTNKVDPKDPSKTLKALDVQYINASAHSGTCYMSPGGTKLEDLVSVDIQLSDKLKG